MSIVDVEKYEVYYVEFDSGEWPHYVRYSSGNWSQRMGESIEPVYFKEDMLEAEFQRYMAARNNRVEDKT